MFPQEGAKPVRQPHPVRLEEAPTSAIESSAQGGFPKPKGSPSRWAQSVAQSCPKTTGAQNGCFCTRYQLIDGSSHHLHLVPGWFLAYSSSCKHLPRHRRSTKAPLEVPIVFASRNLCYLQLPSIGFPLRESTFLSFLTPSCSYLATRLRFITFLLSQ